MALNRINVPQNSHTVVHILAIDTGSYSSVFLSNHFEPPAKSRRSNLLLLKGGPE